MQEIWKKIEEYPNYQISSIGRVKATKYYSNIHKKYYDRELIMKEKTNSHGYKFISFGCGKRGNKKNIAIHRLAAEAFIPNPNNYKEINHIDGNKNNNKVENLEWCNRQYNVLHSYKWGLKKPIQEYIRLKKEADY